MAWELIINMDGGFKIKDRVQLYQLIKFIREKKKFLVGESIKPAQKWLLFFSIDKVVKLGLPPREIMMVTIEKSKYD